MEQQTNPLIPVPATESSDPTDSPTPSTEIRSTKNFYYEHGTWQGKPAILKIKRNSTHGFKDSLSKVYVLSFDVKTDRPAR